VAEGLHLAAEALEADADIEFAVVSPAIERSPEGLAIRERLQQARVVVHETADTVLESLQDARSPQPMVLVARRRDPDLAAVLDERRGPALVMVTHGLQDPGNLGSILRTADAAGATAMVACGEGVDLYHPRAVRATMGSIFRLPVAMADAATVLEELRRRGIATVAADPRAEIELARCGLTSPVALWIGGEGGGLPREILDAADRTVRIPMAAGVESLAAPAAAAVLLYEAARQRR
jgi:TrmH family RNA methyltransferase